LVDGSYDVVIVGGGIHGAGVAQIFAVNSFRVLLLEKHAIGLQTSSRSSKLIHGGLRYLESFQFGLVKECLRERQILLSIAPDLVRLTPFYLPVYKSSLRSRFKIRAGLSLYALLGGLDKQFRFKQCKKSEWAGLDGLKTKNLLAVFKYYDAQTDDLRLTQAVASSASNYGATMLENSDFVEAVADSNGWEIRYKQQQQKYVCKTKLIVNASGPWVNETANRIRTKLLSLDASLVQGTHIEVNKKTKKGVFYIESPIDKRAVFVMPWKSGTLIGTTETVVEKAIENPQPLDSEVEYLLSTYNAYFKKLGKESIVNKFAGLRVLPNSEKNILVFHKSRDTRLVVDRKIKPTVINIVGGKLTVYRNTAEKVFRLAEPTLGGVKKYVDSSKINLKP